ncbi:hypothetical protein PoB_007511200 [Plakobranchus ocellatus]|uniref:Uncharacterized protein n=1 Tax=Plakobranchus ocellatus TaxID=259542 RepID=A0AAV4DX60_9GAST|nr:hypothetical protein PoB_007511200 [Plakobranchus ocellatus]
MCNWDNYKPVHNKVISGFEALRQARARVVWLDPAIERSLQISGRREKKEKEEESKDEKKEERRRKNKYDGDTVDDDKN